MMAQPKKLLDTG